jgi:hypothetical protein
VVNRIFGFTKNMVEAGRKLATRLTSFCLWGVDYTQPINGCESFCGKDLIIEMENSIYRGDMYRFAAKAVR